MILPVQSINLSGPGTVCSGDTVTLTCNITGATTLQWLFNTSIEVITLRSADGLFSLGEHAPVVKRNIEFSFSLLATNPVFVSQLRFITDDNQIQNGVPVSCAEVAGSTLSITTSVEANSKS